VTDRITVPGDRFGKLLVKAVAEPGRKAGGESVRRVTCVCDCGARLTVQAYRLRESRRPMTSCGCVDFEPWPIKATDAAYLAGLIDGEGCFSIARMRRPDGSVRSFTAFLSVGMTDPAVRGVAASVNLGTLQVRPQAKSGWKRCHVWRVGAVECRRLIPTLLPYLRFKKAQAEVMLKYLRLSNRPPRNRAADMDVYLAAADALYWELRQLNRKGV
jgi:hypothetical protein